MSKVKPEVANQRIDSFEKRFGKAHLYLAYHAAFPLALTPDLLYHLWAYFQRDIHSEVLNIPWIAVADLLLSSLCNEVGYELYEMDQVVRNTLLSRLKENQKFSKQRINELSNFLLDYIRQYVHSDDPDVRDFAQAQRWTALAYTQPSEAVRELTLAFLKLDQQHTAELLRLSSLTETFAEPLANFQPLLIYAREMEKIAHENQEDIQIYTKLQSEIVSDIWVNEKYINPAKLKHKKFFIVVILLTIVVLVIELFSPFIRPISYLHEANKLLDERQGEAALDKFNSLKQLQPNSPEVWKGRGDALFLLGREFAALQSYNRAIFLQPKDQKLLVKILINKGKVLYKQQNYQETLDIYEKALKLDENNPEALSGKSLSLLATGKKQEALQYLEQLKQIRPDDPIIWQEIGFAIEQSQGKQAAKEYFQEALSTYDDILRTKNNNPIYWTDRGSILLKLNRPQDALDSYEKALNIDNNYYEALIGKGNALNVLGKPSEALFAFKQASKVRPQDYLVWFNQGILLTQTLRNHEEAIKAFDQTIAIKEDFHPAWIGKALALLEMKRYQEALVAIDKAKTLQPKDPDIWDIRGEILKGLGKQQEANSSYSQAEKLRGEMP